jgi:hypothetical protein
MTTEECHRAMATGNTYILGSPIDDRAGLIDLSVLRAQLPKATACTWEEADGWYQPEALIPDTWRWTEGEGTIEIIMEESGTVLLRGQLRTVEAPNIVRMMVNSTEVASFEVSGVGSEPFETAPVQLEEGTTEIGFVSGNPASSVPNDDRMLAISVWNLEIRLGDGSSPCLKMAPITHNRPFAPAAALVDPLTTQSTGRWRTSTPASSSTLRRPSPGRTSARASAGAILGEQRA